MSSTGPHGRGRLPFGLTSGRVEAFSDGVFAIAATLLIVSVQPPRGTEDGQLVAALLRLWPQYAAYVASFMTIGIMWLNHHALFTRLARVDRSLIMLNLLLLMAIAFLPFPTSVFGEHIQSTTDAQGAALFYSVTAILIALGFNGVYLYVATHPALLRSGFLREDFFRAIPGYAVGVVGYIACLALSLISPVAVVVVLAAIAVYYAFDRLPGRRAEEEDVGRFPPAGGIDRS